MRLKIDLNQTKMRWGLGVGGGEEMALGTFGFYFVTDRFYENS